MRLGEYVHLFLQDEAVRQRVVYVRLLPAEAGRAGTITHPLPEALEQALRRQGVGVLYTHQALALEAARRGDNIVVVSATASGKSLCYNLPVIERILQDPYTRAFYLFPTKALARDQQEKLNALGLFPQVRFGVYDGDTPQADRSALRRGAHIILTNPDMLHVGILPNHTSWSTFLRQLRYVVIDEMHTYRGVFGSHVALVLRRLRRLAQYYGARPQFILTSATVGNPTETAQALTGLKCTLIDQNGAPRPPRYFVMWNPPLAAERSDRLSTNIECAKLLLQMADTGWSTLVFARARVTAELILRYTQALAEQYAPHLKEQIAAYRAGYTPEQRRDLERRLFEGQLRGVVSTNALELGIDVGGLDVVIMAGYPGSITSTWQQAGRAGRRDREALIILVAQNEPLDQYLMRHPEYLFEQPVEKVRLNPTNPSILKAQLCCAAYELPIQPEDYPLFGDAEACMQAIANLMDEGRMGALQGRWYYFGGGYPASEVSIRAASPEVVLVREVNTRAEIAQVEWERAYRSVHPGAIYLHQGESYFILKLDEAQREALAQPTDVDYYTEPLLLVQIQVIRTDETRKMADLQIGTGVVRVSEQVVGFRRKHLASGRVIDIHPLDLPVQSYETEATWIAFDIFKFAQPQQHSQVTTSELLLEVLALLRPQTDRSELVRTADAVIALHGAEHALQAVVPLTCGCERMDIGGHFTWIYPPFARSAIFLYDTAPGGAGISRGAYADMENLLTMAERLVRECSCTEGCPSCLHSPHCPVRNEGLDKRWTKRLLNWLRQQA